MESRASLIVLGIIVFVVASALVYFVVSEGDAPPTHVAIEVADEVSEPSGEPKRSEGVDSDPAEVKSIQRRRRRTRPQPRTVSTTELSPRVREAFAPMSWWSDVDKKARGVYPDAELIDFDAAGVRQDGTIDLDSASGRSARWYFRSEERSSAGGEDCLVMVDASKKGLQTAQIESRRGCTEPLVGAPRCNLRQVWANAIKAGAPSEESAGRASLFEGKWYVEIGEDVFSQYMPDDCGE